MNKSLVAGMALAILAFARSHASEQTVQASPGGQLTVDLDNGGNFELRGWDQNAVRVRARVETPDVQVTLHGVSVHSRLTPSTLEIWVPRHYDLSLKSAGGRLTISEVEGTFTGSIAGGMITIERAKGHAELSTTGGAIHVVDSNLTGSVTTGGGSVSLRNVTGGLRTEARQ